MSYVPTTDAERRAMLDAIGVKEFDALVQAVPADLRFPRLRLPGALQPIAQPKKSAPRHAGMSERMFVCTGSYCWA